MTLTVILDGQYGSCGKGEFVAYLARRYLPIACIRTGGPNAGHTVTSPDDPTRAIKLRHVPAAFVCPSTRLFLSPGGLINTQVLQDEIHELQSAWGWRGSLAIDGNAVEIRHDYEEEERSKGMRERIGSTTEGIGATRARKIWREAVPWREFTSTFGEFLYPNTSTCDVPLEVNRLMDHVIDREDPGMLIESTQGFGLSLELSGNYPFTTSANITPAHLLGECGLSSRLPHQVVVLMRTYPIRVAGNSGPMGGREITWDELHERSGGRAPAGGERTTVTKLVRRVSEWDRPVAQRMAMICRPTFICLTFLDYVFSDLADVTDPEEIVAHEGVDEYLDKIARDCGAPVRWVSTGPGKIADLWDIGRGAMANQKPIPGIGVHGA